jgi:hypothetical protein
MRGARGGAMVEAPRYKPEGRVQCTPSCTMWTDTTKLTVAFRNYAKAPNNYSRYTGTYKVFYLLRQKYDAV